MTKQKTQKAWKNSIVGHGEVDPKTLMPHPENWRLHGDFQQRAMNDVLSEVGWIQQVIVNKTTGRIVDGHLRVKLALDRGVETVPVVYVELSEEDERKALLTLDPMSAIATPDADVFNGLLSSMDTDSLWIRELLDATQKKFLEDKENEEKENGKGGGGDGDKEDGIPEMELQPFESYDYVMLLFKSDQDFASVCDMLGLEKVKVTYPGGLAKIGLGRVVDGPSAIKKIQEKADVGK